MKFEQYLHLIKERKSLFISGHKLGFEIRWYRTFSVSKEERMSYVSHLNLRSNTFLSLRKTVGKVSPILVTLTSRSNSDFERSKVSLKENRPDGVDPNSNDIDYYVRKNEYGFRQTVLIRCSKLANILGQCWVCKRGNIRETFKVSVSSVFPKWFFVCYPKQHMLKTQNLRLGSKKCFWNFPKTFFASWTHFCFRNNVSLFAPALM